MKTLVAGTKAPRALPALLSCLLFAPSLSAQLPTAGVNGEPGGLSIEVHAASPLGAMEPLSLGAELLSRDSSLDASLLGLDINQTLPGLGPQPSGAEDGSATTPCDGAACRTTEPEADGPTVLRCEGDDCRIEARCSLADAIAGIAGCGLDTGEHRLLIPSDVAFEFDSARLTPNARELLEQMIPLLRRNDDALFAIYGHTDGLGGTIYNLHLSQQRARAVRNYLVGAGIAEDRLVYRGYGASRPIAPNTAADGTDNPQGRALNRRVEFAVVGRDAFVRLAAERRQLDQRIRAERKRIAALLQQRREALASTSRPAAAENGESSAERGRPAPEFESQEFLDFLRQHGAGGSALASNGSKDSKDKSSDKDDNYTLEVIPLDENRL